MYSHRLKQEFVNGSPLCCVIMTTSQLVLYKKITMEPHLSGPHISGLFTHLYTCLGTNPHSSADVIQLSGQSVGNGGVRISEAQLYTALTSTCTYLWFLELNQGPPTFKISISNIIQITYSSNTVMILSFETIKYLTNVLEHWSKIITALSKIRKYNESITIQRQFDSIISFLFVEIGLKITNTQRTFK